MAASTASVMYWYGAITNIAPLLPLSSLGLSRRYFHIVLPYATTCEMTDRASAKGVQRPPVTVCRTTPSASVHARINSVTDCRRTQRVTTRKKPGAMIMTSWRATRGRVGGLPLQPHTRRRPRERAWAHEHNADHHMVAQHCAEHLHRVRRTSSSTAFSSSQTRLQSSVWMATSSNAGDDGEGTVSW